MAFKYFVFECTWWRLFKYFVFECTWWRLFKYFVFECTWWRLFQKRVMHTKFDIYVFNSEIEIISMAQIIYLIFYFRWRIYFSIKKVGLVFLIDIIDIKWMNTCFDTGIINTNDGWSHIKQRETISVVKCFVNFLILDVVLIDVTIHRW